MDQAYFLKTYCGGGICMYDFFYRVNSFTLLLLTIPQRYRYWLTILLCFFIMGIWYAISYVPYSNAIRRYAQQHGMHQAKADEQSKLYDAYEATKALYQERKKEYDAKIKEWQSPTLLAIITTIFEYVEQHGLFFNAYRPGPIYDEGWYKRHTCFLELQGSFNAMLSLLEFMQKSSYPLFCDTLHIKKVDNDNIAFTCLITVLEIKKEEDEANKTSKKTNTVLDDQHYSA